MKKEIVQIDKKAGIARVTTRDERWYFKIGGDKKTGLPEVEYRPSMSWIAGKYPKGIGYMKWLASKGWDEAEAIKSARGDEGTKVHKGCEKIALGEDVKMEDLFENKNTGELEQLTVEEYEGVISFRAFWDSIQDRNPKILLSEFNIWTDEYAGTADLLIEMDKEKGEGREVWLIDLKTSQSIFESHQIQIDGYFNAPIKVEGKPVKPDKMAIVQLGYRKNIRRWKFTEIKPCSDMRQDAYNIWKRDHGEEKPHQRDLPLYIEGIREKVVEEEKETK